MRVMLLACLALLGLTSGWDTDLRTVMLVSIGSGAASALLAFMFLHKRVTSLGTQGTDELISTKDTLRDALPILIISLTSFVLLSAADLWILGSTLSGIPSLLVLIVFMLLGGPILGVVYGSGYQSAAMVLVLLSAGKLAAVWAGSCGAVLQFTGHQGSMLRVNLLTSPLFIVGALLVVRDYGPIGVASMTAAITVLQNVALVLVAKRKTGMWTHVSLSPSHLPKGLSKR
jgi:O-antigen/teichoic acid export membrane protein